MSPKTLKTILVFIFLLFGFIFCLISITNHYLFRTSALDLGIFNHAAYNYAHLQSSYFTLGLTEKETGIVECFGNHFSPFIFLLAPFYFIFGTYSLLVFQIIAVLIGGFGVYQYGKIRLTNQQLLPLIVIQFFSIWGIYSALAFDFHLSVIASMLVPWLFFYHHKGKLKSFLLILLLIVLTRENMSLWMAFVLAGIWMDKRLRSAHFKPMIYPVLISCCIIYFLLAMKVFMPHFTPYESSGQLSRYAHLGESVPDIIKNLLIHPSKLFDLLFANTLNDTTFNGIKLELHTMVLLAGGALFLIRPAFLVMLIPIYLQKLLSNDYGMWGINNHYSIEFVPIMSLLLIEVVSRLKSTKWQTALLLLFTISTIWSTTTKLLDRKAVWYQKTKACFFCREHYRSQYNIREINRELDNIPKKAAVSSFYALAPHLAYREKIYHFPVVKDSDYIAILKTTDNFYPLCQEDYYLKIEELRNDNQWIVENESADIIIFKRIESKP